MYRILLVLMVFDLYSTTTYSQDSRIKSQSPLTQVNESSIPALIKLAEKQVDLYPDTAYAIYRKILNVLLDSNIGISYCRYKAAVLINLARINVTHKTDYDSGLIKASEALRLYDKLLLICERDDLTTEAMAGKGNCYLNIGRIYERRGFFPFAIQNYLEATKIFSELDEDKNIARCYINIGSIHDCIGDYKNSFEYYNKALEILKKYDVSNDLGECYLYFGLRYDGLAQRDSSISYYFKALDVYKKLNNVVGMGQTYYNIAETFVIYDSSYSEKEAKKYFHYSMKYLLPTGELFSLSELYCGLSNLYNKIERYDSAKMYAFQGLKIANNLKSINLKILPYYYLSNAYESTGKSDSALIFMKLYVDAYDSLYSNEYKQACIDAAVKESISSYYTDLQNEELRIKRKWNIILGVMVFLTIIFASTLYYITKRNIRNKNKIKIRDSVIEGEEKERNRIGRELHDGVCSELSAVKMNLDIVKSTCSDQIEIGKVITNLSTINESIRNISHDLNSIVLSKFGLVPAINDLFEKVRILNNSKVKLEISTFNKRLQKSIESNIYRILQEIVNNILKHANATEINFSLGQTKDSIRMIVKDNGVGFDVKSEKPRIGIGLNNIKYRVALLNGQITIHSDLNVGTTITIEIPLVE